MNEKQLADTFLAMLSPDSYWQCLYCGGLGLWSDVEVGYEDENRCNALTCPHCQSVNRFAGSPCPIAFSPSQYFRDILAQNPDAVKEFIGKLTKDKS